MLVRDDVLVPVLVLILGVRMEGLGLEDFGLVQLQPEKVPFQVSLIGARFKRTPLTLHYMPDL